MNKTQLKDFLSQHFQLVLDNNDSPEVTIQNKEILGIVPGDSDDKSFAFVADYVAMNQDQKKFFFMYYGKKNTTLIYDNDKKMINVRLANNATKRNQYGLLIKKIKKTLPKSKCYLIFFTVDKAEFSPDNNNQRIFVLNEQTIDQYLSKYYDF